MTPVTNELILFRERLVGCLRELGVIRNIRPGATIAGLDRGEPLIYLVVSGTATIQIIDVENAAHDSVTVTHVAPFGLFGMPAADQSGYSRDLKITATAKSACSIIELRHADILQLGSAHPDVMMELYAGLSRFTFQVMNKVGQFAFYSARGRISQALVELCALPEAIRQPDGYVLKPTRVEIAKLVGCTREMVGRVMKELNDEGFITTSGRTTIVHLATAAA